MAANHDQPMDANRFPQGASHIPGDHAACSPVKYGLSSLELVALLFPEPWDTAEVDIQESSDEGEAA